MSDKADSLFKKVQKHKGVEGSIICDRQGIPVKSTIANEDKVYLYTTGASKFLQKCKDNVKTIIKEDLKLLRIRFKGEEILIIPNNDLILIIIQKPFSNN